MFRTTLLVAAGAAFVLSLAGCQSESPETTDAPPPATEPELAPPAHSPEPPAVASIRQVFQCGEQRVEASFSPDSVLLDIGGRSLRLAQTVSASGARYGDGDPEFWSRGMTEASLVVDGERFDCTALEPGARSPWAEARERDVGYRAVGQEPGWFVEVDLGESPAIRGALDYGAREFSLDASEAFTDGEVQGWRGEWDGEALTLQVEHQDCMDSMSGEGFETRAQLRLGETTLQGCGRYLFD